MESDSNGSGDEQNRRRYRDRIKTTDKEPATAGGQPIPLEEGLDTGSKSWDDIQKDKWRLSYRPSYPAHTSARTTLWARQADDEEQFEVLFLLQHGRQHPAERQADGYSEGWDGQKVRQEDVFKFCRSHVILSQAGVAGPVKDWTVQKVMRENLNGFSRYYEGIDGAALGFATLYKYDDVEMAKESYIVDEAEEMFGVDGEKLVDYVWRKYGDDVR